MKIKFKHDTILEMLNLSAGMVQQKSLITSAVEISAKENEVFLQCTNYTEGLRGKIVGSEITKEGEIVIDTKRILDIISELPNSEISIEKLENSYIKIKSNVSSKIKLATIPDPFPTIFQDVDNLDFFKIKTKDLQDILTLAFYSSSKDESKLSIAGVYIESDKESITAVGLDGYRISIATKKTKGIKEGLSSLIPNNALKNILKILSTTKFEFVQMSITETQVFLKCKDLVYFSMLISKTYPTYKSIIPEDGYDHKEVALNKELLLPPLKRIQIIAKENDTPAKFLFSENCLTISAENSVCGSIEEKIDIDYSDIEFSFLLNSSYIIDLFTAFNCNIVIEYDFTEDGKPIVIIPKDIEETKALIMPMVL